MQSAFALAAKPDATLSRNKVDNNLPVDSEARPLSVCAWCMPKAEMERLNRLFAGLSHGLCQTCYDKWNADLDAKYGATA